MNQMKSDFPGSKSGIILRNLVSRLVCDSQAAAIQLKTIIINEVPAGMHVLAEEPTISPVIAELLSTVVANSNKGRIFISAERFRDMIIFHVQDRNNYNGYALAYSIKSMEPLANSLGGFITIKGQQQLETTISLGIPTHLGVPRYDC